MPSQHRIGRRFVVAAACLIVAAAVVVLAQTPQMATWYNQAATDYDSAAAQAPADQKICYQAWATHYRCLAGNLVSGRASQPCDAPTCVAGGIGSSAAARGPGSAGGLNPGNGAGPQAGGPNAAATAVQALNALTDVITSQLQQQSEQLRQLITSEENEKARRREQTFQKSTGEGDDFIVAAEDASPAALDNILHKGVYINSVYSVGGETPLMSAVENGNLETAQFLVDHGADISAEDDDGRTALNFAAKHCDTPTVIYLLSKGANPYHLAYFFADDPSSGLPELQAKSSGCDDTARILAHLRKKDPLIETALGKVRLAPSGAINLNRAVRREGLGEDYGEKVAALLQAGSEANSPDDFGYTPLQNAFWTWGKCNENVPSLVQMLLNKSADPNATDMFGQTAMMIAASHNCTSVDVFRALLDKGARVDIRDFEGKTVIDLLRPKVKDNQQLKPLLQMLESRLKK